MGQKTGGRLGRWQGWGGGGLLWLSSAESGPVTQGS